MRADDEIFVNQVVQGVRSVDDGIVWFSDLSQVLQQAVLRKLSYYALQSGAMQADVVEAISRARLRPTLTPCVLLQKGDPRSQVAKIISLPRNEYVKAFRLLLQWFAVADERRRSARCTGGCKHWWHWDLGNDEVLAKVYKLLVR